MVNANSSQKSRGVSFSEGEKSSDRPPIRACVINLIAYESSSILKCLFFQQNRFPQFDLKMILYTIDNKFYSISQIEQMRSNILSILN